MLRYRRKNIISKDAGISTFEGLDPLTGLAVYIYEFEGPIDPNLTNLESENISGILDIASEGTKNQVITAFSKGYRVLRSPLRIDTNILLLDSARALRDAARLNIVHGDINPERFLATDRHVVIEGYGMPWQVKTSSYKADGEANSLQADIHAWGRSVLELTNGNLPESMMKILNSCVAAEVKARPSAKRVYRALSEVIEKSKRPTLDTLELTASSTKSPIEAQATFGDDAGYLPLSGKGSDSSNNFNKDLNSLNEGFQPTTNISKSRTNPASMPIHDKPIPSANSEFKKPDETTLRGPIAKEKPTKRTGFVRDLPPGSTYKKGDSFTKSKSKSFLDEFDEIDNNSDADKPKNRARFFVLLLVFLAAASLGAFALFRQGQVVDPNPTLVVQHYVVDVEILPSNLPPVDVVVVSSPAGSALKPNTILQRVSGKESIALDKEGVWELQGRFQNSSSDVVRFSLPQDRHVLITIKPSTP